MSKGALALTLTPFLPLRLSSPTGAGTKSMDARATNEQQQQQRTSLHLSETARRRRVSSNKRRLILETSVKGELRSAPQRGAVHSLQFMHEKQQSSIRNAVNGQRVRRGRFVRILQTERRSSNRHIHEDRILERHINHCGHERGSTREGVRARSYHDGKAESSHNRSRQ
jgi:hypothetical protein